MAATDRIYLNIFYLLIIENLVNKQHWISQHCRTPHAHVCL